MCGIIGTDILYDLLLLMLLWAAHVHIDFLDRTSHVLVVCIFVKPRQSTFHFQKNDICSPLHVREVNFSMCLLVSWKIKERVRERERHEGCRNHLYCSPFFCLLVPCRRWVKIGGKSSECQHFVYSTEWGQRLKYGINDMKQRV